MMAKEGAVRVPIKLKKERMEFLPIGGIVWRQQAFTALGEGPLAGTGEGHASLNRYFFNFR